MAGRRYQVWYMRPTWFRQGIMGRKPVAKVLAMTHIHVTDMVLDAGQERPLEWIFAGMQGEVWSPNGEANDVIKSKGLEHTSMSVGDAIVDPEGRVHVVASMGFEKIGTRAVVNGNGTQR